MAEELDDSLSRIHRFGAQNHVAQQSRREKLRVQNTSNLERETVGLPSHLINPLCDSSMVSSEMLNFRAQRVSSEVNSEVVPSDGGLVQNPTLWKGLIAPQNCDWFLNHSQGNGASPSSLNNHDSFLTPMFGILSKNLKDGNSSAYQLLLMNNEYNNIGYPQDLQVSMASQNPNPNPIWSSKDVYDGENQKPYTEFSRNFRGFEQSSQGLDLGSPRRDIKESVASGLWQESASGLVLPSYGNQSSLSGLSERPQTHQWCNGEGEAQIVRKQDGHDARSQSLALSLASHRSTDTQLPQFEDGFNNSQELVVRENRSEGSFPNPFYGSTSRERNFSPLSQGYIGGSSMDAQRSAGPLGPFTGYATILKSSKFLRPAQLILSEFCSVTKGAIECGMKKPGINSDSIERGSMVLRDGVNVDSGGIGRNGNSCVSSSSDYPTSIEGGNGGGDKSGGAVCAGDGIEFHKKKTRLMALFDEVYRRYRIYQHQMQSVISSFESIAGLSAATPYTSLALKAMSKHFRCLKNVISDQLKQMSSLLGEEESMIPAGGPNFGKGDTIPRLRFLDQRIRHQQQQRLMGLEHARHQHVWRPQRGLPERSVAVLRAWLFEHFLHPYPTDNDKHVLASQTGLSRNQVSNWFINARVRLWKPMVEEIHMLESKESAEFDQNSSKNDHSPANPEQASKKQGKQSIEAQSSEDRSFSVSSRVGDLEQPSKRPKMDHCRIPTSYVDFPVYPTGVGAVSLTLGLQHSGVQEPVSFGLHENSSSSGFVVENLQQQLRKQIPGHILHDFVG
ncbi:BEL1-like homeodomain protein 4 [Amborella trichopoda]|uniref:Homeobox domain-containing protein n=1 Tax=Amborella trichopoda TaxID=13333 RepID=W1NI56_AMBTC|nr:BEL1-like homeodomain protein 4 [Amborella trichopoda]XP_020527432.1 BEL1-like homeodomain protein 4 [Amborella trichopoda]ERM94865.1 hypothetical protein AMTR_s00009p00109990 [Amborella trichopoda]|eukprot:XP_006827449.1 BEL1-like homeodomain protein 4 [Amborella trichopoda]